MIAAKCSSVGASLSRYPDAPESLSKNVLHDRRIRRTRRCGRARDRFVDHSLHDDGRGPLAGNERAVQPPHSANSGDHYSDATVPQSVDTR